MTARPDPALPQREPSDPDALFAHHVGNGAGVASNQGRHLGSKDGGKEGRPEPGVSFPGPPRHRRE